MSVLIDEEVQAFEHPRPPGISPASVSHKLAELIAGVKARLPIAQPDPFFHTPGVSVAAEYSQEASYTLERAPAPPDTLAGLTPRQIKALSKEEFRVRFAATPVNTLRPAQLLLIQADKAFREVAREVREQRAVPKTQARTQPQAQPQPPSPEMQPKPELRPRVKTLLRLTPEHIRALSSEEFRARFIATPLHALTPEQLALIEGEKRLRAIADDALDGMKRKQETLRVTLPKGLAAFVAQQVEAGLYRDASELISESLRFFQKQTDLDLLRLSLASKPNRVSAASKKAVSPS